MEYWPRLCAIILLAISTPSLANMVLSDAIVHFEAGGSNRSDIEVRNTGEEPLYIQVQPHLVRQPGSPEEVKEPYKNPKQYGLLVTPNKLVIAPGSRKLLRFVNLQPSSDTDRIYRVTVTPIVGEVSAEQTAVKIVIAYEVLVLIQPNNPQPQIEAIRDGQRLTLHNRGNTNVLFREGKQCPSDDSAETECTNLPGKRIYAGQRWDVELPFDRPVEYYYSIGTENAVAVYP